MTHPAVHIIDDDAATRTQLKTLVETAGFKVACYPDTEQFLVVADSVCGCVLIDLWLPGLSGLELLQARIRRR